MVANQNIRPCWILIKTYKYASKSALIKEMKMLCPRWFMRLYVGNGSFSKWIQSSDGDILNGEHFFSGQERQERAAENYRAEVFWPQKQQHLYLCEENPYLVSFWLHFKVIRLLELLARQRAEVRRQELGDQGARRGGEEKSEMQEQGRRRGSERELEGRSSNTSSESCSTRSRGRALGTVGSRGDRARSQERQVLKQWNL